MKRFFKYFFIIASLLALVGVLTRKITFETSGDDTSKNTFVCCLFYQSNEINKRDMAKEESNDEDSE